MRGACGAARIVDKATLFTCVCAAHGFLCATRFGILSNVARDIGTLDRLGLWLMSIPPGTSEVLASGRLLAANLFVNIQFAFIPDAERQAVVEGLG
jgi:hypothetical protein